MTLSDLQSLIADLTNDPNHDRYSLAQMNTELDVTQNQWNVEAKIIKDTAQSRPSRELASTSFRQVSAAFRYLSPEQPIKAFRWPKGIKLTLISMRDLASIGRL